MKIKEDNILCPTTLTDAYLGKCPNNCEWVDDNGTVNGKICDRNCPQKTYCECNWITAWGGGKLTPEGEIIHASFSLNEKVTIYIIGKILRIVDIRHKGKADIWEYASCEDFRMRSLFHKYHELEPEKIEEYLNAEGTSNFWKLIQKKAKEIYEKNR